MCAGLRRRAAFLIEREHVDLDTGWLTIPAENQKQKVEQRFKLSDQTVEAIRPIWSPRRRQLFPWPWRRETIPKAPEFEMLNEDRPRPKIFPDEDFAKLYRNCGAAVRPKALSVPAAEWWQALLIFLRYTGWRVSEALSRTWADVDLEPDQNGEYWATTRAADNKGGRTERIPLLPIVVQHLRPIRTFAPAVFPWKGSDRALYVELGRIARAAGVVFPHNGRRRDVFHCLRKTFGTNAALPGIDTKALTSLMRHRNYATTERYYLDAEVLMTRAMEKIEVAAPILEAVGWWGEREL